MRYGHTLQNPILSKRRKLVQKEAAESEIRDAKARIAANNKVLERRRMQNKDSAKPGQRHVMLPGLLLETSCHRIVSMAQISLWQPMNTPYARLPHVEVNS